MPLQSRAPDSSHINIDKLGVYACELANESVSKSEVCVVSLLALSCLGFFVPGFIVLHFLKLEEFLKREQANFKCGGMCFTLLLHCCACAGQHGGERLVPASLAALPFVDKALLDCCGMPGSWEAVLARQARAGFSNRDKGKFPCFEVFF